MNKPKRIQRKRTKGWKMPPNTVCVTRPGKYGNPFIVSEKLKPGRSIGVVYFAVPTVEDSIECFREYAAEKLAADPHWLDALRGSDLACFCGLDKPCHGDVLLELANNTPPNPPAGEGAERE